MVVRQHTTKFVKCLTDPWKWIKKNLRDVNLRKKSPFEIRVCLLSGGSRVQLDHSPALSQLRGFILCSCICFWNTETALTTTRVGQEE